MYSCSACPRPPLRNTRSGAEAPAPKRAAPSLEQRVADLEAYVNNWPRGADTNINVSSNLGTYDEKANSFTPNPGPGPNAWQMTCAALVLFMTLPGLALFYGGLVRRKNVLSIMAQCLLITGLVTILWYICGYSLVFHHGNRFLGNLGFAFLTTSIPPPTPIIPLGFRQMSSRCTN